MSANPFRPKQRARYRLGKSWQSATVDSVHGDVVTIQPDPSPANPEPQPLKRHWRLLEQ